MIGAKAAIVGTSPLHRRVVVSGHFGGLETLHGIAVYSTSSAIRTLSHHGQGTLQSNTPSERQFSLNLGKALGTN